MLIGFNQCRTTIFALGDLIDAQWGFHFHGKIGDLTTIFQYFPDCCKGKKE
jgi:hypothetical protein